jgi:hypothetical protein
MAGRSRDTTLVAPHPIRHQGSPPRRSLGALAYMDGRDSGWNQDLRPLRSYPAMWDHCFPADRFHTVHTCAPKTTQFSSPACCRVSAGRGADLARMEMNRSGIGLKGVDHGRKAPCPHARRPVSTEGIVGRRATWLRPPHHPGQATDKFNAWSKKIAWWWKPVVQRAASGALAGLRWTGAAGA